MLRNVRVAAGFELRIGLELGEVSVIHNAVTNQPDLEGTAVSMAARIEASAKPGENTDNR
jgi:class 3 adenylate cyclase